MKNHFEKHIQDAMSKHEFPVSDSVWASIQQNRSKKPLIYYISRVSAACLLLIIGFFTFSTYHFYNTDINTIVIEQKQIGPIDFNFQQPELKQVFAKIPTEPIIKHKVKPIHNTIIESQIDSDIPEQEVIVLTIKRNKTNTQRIYKAPIYIQPRQNTHVDSEVLLTQIEEKLNINNKKALESYLTDIKKLASKNSINNKIQTAQNWLNKTASDFRITNKKNKDND